MTKNKNRHNQNWRLPMCCNEGLKRPGSALPSSEVHHILIIIVIIIVIIVIILLIMSIITLVSFYHQRPNHFHILIILKIPIILIILVILIILATILIYKQPHPSETNLVEVPAFGANFSSGFSHHWKLGTWHTGQGA